jgi:hypothetical protein
MLADSEEISSQSPEPRSVSGDGLYTPFQGYASRVFFCSIWGFCSIWVSYKENKLVTEFSTSHPLMERGYSYKKPWWASWGVQYCRGSRKLCADSVWRNQGKFKTYSNSQKNGQDGSNIPLEVNCAVDSLSFCHVLTSQLPVCD